MNDKFAYNPFAAFYEPPFICNFNKLSLDVLIPLGGFLLLCVIRVCVDDCND